MDKTVLAATPFILTILVAGCSGRIEFAPEPSQSGDKAVVGIDLTTTPDAPPSRDERRHGQMVVGDGNVIITAQHTHFHFHETATRNGATSVLPSQHDAECDRLRREHYERVARREAMIGN